MPSDCPKLVKLAITDKNELQNDRGQFDALHLFARVRFATQWYPDRKVCRCTKLKGHCKLNSMKKRKRCMRLLASTIASANVRK
jgi:hypothetical protein